ncbi:MAG: molybdopterin-dependent oxidoreductase [Chloroflexota bacterium]
MTVNLTIDGISVEVADGTTVLNAARQAGIDIPTLCDHPHLTPFGGCRLCIVEVQGFRVPIASCTLPATNGMVVQTDTEKLRASRKFILSMLFSERNHFCPFCQQSGGDCELQNAAYHEGMTHWPMVPAWKKFTVDTSHPYYVLDNNRCILCRRCVRACAEVTGNFTLGIAERGSNSMLVADYDVPLGESSCVECGNCVQVCPTGALIDRQSAYHGKAHDLDRTQSICITCSLNCGIEVLTADNNLARIEGNWDAPVNAGALCKRGRFEPVAESRKRITTPMVKKNGKLESVTWDEALAAIAAKVKPLAGKNGGGVAALASTRLPLESLALFRQLFGEKLGSTMVTSLEEGYPTAVSAAVAEELGRPFEANVEALRQADCILAVGTDLFDSHQVAGFMVKRNLPKGVRLAVIDANENVLDEYALYSLKATAGSDSDVIVALQAALAQAGKGAVDFDARKALGELPAKTGVPIENIAAVANLLAGAERPLIVYGKGITFQRDAAALKALVKLGEMVGAGLLSIKGKSNSLGAAQLHLDKVFELGGQQAVYVAAGDDQLSDALLARLQKAPFLAVQASYESALTEMADVVLPVTMWAEQSGHYVNLEGRVQEARAALQPPAGVRDNGEALQAVAVALGQPVNADWQVALKQRVAAVTIQ